MEFGKSNLTSSGLVSLLEVFEKHRKYLQVKALKLFQNLIEDRGIACLARLLYAQSEAIEEVHFFDNRITTEGVLDLLLALALHPDKAYPWVNRHEKCQPVWAKFEGNKISCSATNIEGLVKRIVPSFSICVGDDRSLCGPNRCGKIDGKNKDTSPICHLFTQFYRERNIGPTSPEIVNELETLTDEIETQIRVTYSEVPAADMPPPTPPSIGVASSIAFDQLVDSQASLKPAVCRICSQGLRDPLKSLKCKHRFCRACFLSHKDQVVGPSKKPIATIPCPVCDVALARDDVKPIPLDELPRVKCRHHVSLRDLSVGEQAAVVEAAFDIACYWAGPVSEMHTHLTLSHVERIVREQLSAPMEAAQKFASVVKNIEKISTSLNEQESLKLVEFASEEPKLESPKQRTRSIMASSPPLVPADPGLVVVLHSFESEDPNTLRLEPGMVVRVVERSNSGWAAGIVVDRLSGSQLSFPGWFPASYAQTL